MRRLAIIISVFLAFSCAGKTDILIIGGSTSGTAAMIQAARMGSRVVLTEESPWLGGMLTAAGVSATDGNYFLKSGLFDEFSDSLAAYYGGFDAMKTGWVSNMMFEPHVAERIFENMASECPVRPEIMRGTSFVSAAKTGRGWRVTVLENGRKKVIDTKILIDATELGDVARAVGVPYSIGMDSRKETGESIAPEEANDIVQDLTWLMVLKDYGDGTDQTIEMPADYRPELYYNCSLNQHNHDLEEVSPGQFVKKDTRQNLWTPGMMMYFGRLPVKDPEHPKYMVNWIVDACDAYVNIIDASPERRREALDSCKNVTLGFLYFIQTELGLKNLGLTDDEFPTEDGLPLIPYYRESRRIDGIVRFTMDDAAMPFRNNLYRAALGSGTYPVDHHHFRHPRWKDIPHIHFYPIPSYGLPAGVMLPKATEDFIVAEKSISVTNVINGSTRLQPVVMQIGQAAGALATLAIRKGIEPRDVPVRELQDEMLAAGVYIMPYNDLDNLDAAFAPVQRIGATGILRGDGLPIAWENQTWMRVDDPLLAGELYLDEYYGHTDIPCQADGSLSWEDGEELVSHLSGKTVSPSGKEGTMSRKDFCILLDSYADPFHAFPIDWNGNIKNH